MVFAGLVILAGLATPSSAHASDPVSIYVVPRQVEQSAGSPARVTIHGAFVRLTSATTATYSAPQCGVMYFQCSPGDETLCRMQWDELAAAAQTPSPTSCAGFGSLRVVSSATLRAEGAALGSPDAWDLGLGIGEGMYVDGQCPLARALVCPAPGAADGGATDSATTVTGSGGAAAGGSTGSAGGAGVSGSGVTGGVTAIPGSGGATPASGGAAPPLDAGAGGGAAGHPGSGGAAPTATPSARRSGCAVGGAMPHGPQGLAVALVMALGVVMALAGRRRRIPRHQR
jgi:MYXO-CTERM domain-containing protein